MTRSRFAWSRYLDEARDAGYHWTELGPYGYCPTDPVRLRDEFARRDLALTGGTVSAGLHRGRDALTEARSASADVARTLTALGARFLILIPESWSDLAGSRTGPSHLTADEWTSLTTGATALGRYARDDLGLELVVHPHADTNVGTSKEIERFLGETDPSAVNLCLDTGHVAYCGGNNLQIIESFPDRVSYVHLKQVDPTIHREVVAEQIGFAPAVRRGVMVEPPLGEPSMPEILAALEGLDRDIYCIVEQDMYPCDFGQPLPIAIRTREYYAAAGLRLHPSAGR